MTEYLTAEMDQTKLAVIADLESSDVDQENVSLMCINVMAAHTARMGVMRTVVLISLHQLPLHHGAVLMDNFLATPMDYVFPSLLFVMDVQTASILLMKQTVQGDLATLHPALQI